MKRPLIALSLMIAVCSVPQNVVHASAPVHTRNVHMISHLQQNPLHAALVVAGMWAGLNLVKPIGSKVTQSLWDSLSLNSIKNKFRSFRTFSTSGISALFAGYGAARITGSLFDSFARWQSTNPKTKRLAQYSRIPYYIGALTGGLGAIQFTWNNVQSLMTNEAKQQPQKHDRITHVGGFPEELEMLVFNLKQALKDPADYKSLGNGFILGGPAGIGKTHLVKVLAEDILGKPLSELENAEADDTKSQNDTDSKKNGSNLTDPSLQNWSLPDSPFIELKRSDITAGWQGGPEVRTEALFDHLKKMRAKYGFAFLFMDEIESYLASRDTDPKAAKFVTDILSRTGRGQQERGILLFGGTNRPGDIDSAAKNRFKVLHILPPNAQQRQDLISTFITQENLNHLFNADDVRTLAEYSYIPTRTIEETIKQIPQKLKYYKSKGLDFDDICRMIHNRVHTDFAEGSIEGYKNLVEYCRHANIQLPSMPAHSQFSQQAQPPVPQFAQLAPQNSQNQVAPSQTTTMLAGLLMGKR